MRCFEFLIDIFIFSFAVNNVIGTNPIWQWQCIDGYCQKQRVIPGSEGPPLSLPACQLLCLSYGALWPQPTGETSIGNTLVSISMTDIIVVQTPSEGPVASLINAGSQLFLEQVASLTTPELEAGSKSLLVTVNVIKPETQLTLDTDESYTLKVFEASDEQLNATITALTYFGARHALETLGQLIIYDDIQHQLRMPKDVSINDKPVYSYRGILLDTSRNYISVETIKRTIHGMSASKLNTFHWHITDSQSFPYVSQSRPELSKLGAYTEKQIYSPSDIEEVVEYARIRGVRVLPEFDAPAHVGEGWQDTDFVACFNKQPWKNYCFEPPCGQFDPTKPKLYDALEDIFKDIIAQFNPDVFHMGGDEVSFSCWNSTQSIVDWMQKERGWGRNEEDFIKLWNEFQSQALDRFDKQAGQRVPIIVWTSTLTKNEYVEQYLPKDRYIIQVWTTKRDKQIKQLLEKDYKLILSNYDALYLDCGFASWLEDGSNWCSPYKGWQKIYENSPAKIAGERQNQMLGAEAALWTEQVDDASVDNRIWPRGAALAERLWAEPKTSWRDAEARILIHRQRLTQRGIRADALEPQWCLQYEESCPMTGKLNKN